MLENLGDVQAVIDSRYYYLAFDPEIGSEGASRIRGYGSVIMIRDLMMLMPEPGPSAGESLYETWQLHFAKLDQLDSEGRHTPAASNAEKELSQISEHTRTAVMDVLRNLD